MKKGEDYIGVGVGAMIFNDEGKVLLAKRGPGARDEQGLWEFPGGGIRFGEPVLDAIKREIKEECNIDIEILELLGVYDFIPDSAHHWLCPSYIARYVSGELKIMEPKKCEELKWVDMAEIDINSLAITSKGNYQTYIGKYGFNAP